MRKLILFISIIALLTGCKGSSNKDKRPILIVSIEPYRYFVNQISGERFKVETLVPGDSSPESYEPTPKQMLDLINSRGYLSSGYIDFERTRLSKITEENPDLPVYNLSKGIRSIKDSDGDGIDPHVWLSPQNVSQIANNICIALCELDTANCAEYKQRTDSFLQHISDIDKQINAITDSLTNRSFLIYHPALTYFAKDYGLKQLPVCVGGKTASPAHLKTLLKQSQMEEANIIFVQKQFPASIAQQISKDADLRIVEINPLAYEWDKEMLLIAKSLYK